MPKTKYIYRGILRSTLIEYKGKRGMRLGSIKPGDEVEIIKDSWYLDSNDKSIRPFDSKDWLSGVRASLEDLEVVNYESQTDKVSTIGGSNSTRKRKGKGKDIKRQQKRRVC